MIEVLYNKCVECGACIKACVYQAIRKTDTLMLPPKDSQAFFDTIKTKSVVNDTLAPLFPDVRFEEPDLDSDFASDIDYLGWVGDKAFGIQIKPMTNIADIDNYKPSERMQASFTDFEKQYGGKVFIVYSMDGEIGNEDVIISIQTMSSVR